MSDYEATAYLSLEKLKVKFKNLNSSLGKTYVRVPVILRKDKKRVKS